MRVMLPLALTLAGLLAGTASGYLLRPQGEAGKPGADTGEAGAQADAASGKGAAHASAGTDAAAAHTSAEAALQANPWQPTAEPGTTEFIRLSQDLIVPLVEGGRVAAVVAVGLQLEVENAGVERARSGEPRLQDAFLRVLFDHANAGGFNGSFTDSQAMAELRAALTEAAGGILGPELRGVLITDLVRRDG